jgi:neutral ceramidase
VGEAARIGIVLASEVLRTYKKLEPIDPCGLQVARETVPLPPVELQPGDVEKAKSLAARDKAGDSTLTLLERVFAQRVFFALQQQGRPLDVEVHAIALGQDLAWVSLPSEVFVEIGLAIKRGSPYHITIVHSLAYDWIRYVPDRKGFQHGAYEAINTRCGPGGGEALADAAIRCLLRLHKAPQLPSRA